MNFLPSTYIWLISFWNISDNHLNFTDFLNLERGEVYFFNSLISLINILIPSDFSKFQF